MSEKVNPSHCPNCESPLFNEKSTLSDQFAKATGTTNRLWFVCGSFGYGPANPEKFKLESRSALCCEREQTNLWKTCAEKLAKAIKNLNPDFRVQANGEHSEERKALDGFDRLMDLSYWVSRSNQCEKAPKL